MNTHQKWVCGNGIFILCILHSVILNQGYTYRYTASLNWKHWSRNCTPLSSDTKVIGYNTSDLESEKRLNKIYVYSMHGFRILQTALPIRSGILKLCTQVMIIKIQCV